MSCWFHNDIRELSFFVCRSMDPLELLQLSYPGNLWIALVTPKFEAPTAKMRAVLPKTVSMKSFVKNSTMGGALVGMWKLEFLLRNRGWVVCHVAEIYKWFSV